MGFRPEVAEALGADRAANAWAGAEDLIAMAEASPDAASNVLYQVLELRATNHEEAEREISAKLQASGAASRSRDWSGIPLESADGRFGALVSPYFRHHSPKNSEDGVYAFRLAEIHMRLGVWWLNHTWRAAELAKGARDGLQRWDVLIAAASARSLLEGAAYLTVELPEIIRLWDGLKSKGHPKSDEVTTFLRELTSKTFTAHYSTKLMTLNKSKGKERSSLESRSVQTYIEKIAKQNPDAGIMYGILCDAIHPSFGSALRYCTEVVEDRLKSQRLEQYHRNALPHTLVAGNTLPPVIAEAAAEAMTLSAQLLRQDLRAIRWLIDDIYLTAELQPPSAGLNFPWAIKTPERNTPCPCGSGRKFKRCVHRWGLPGTSPAE